MPTNVPLLLLEFAALYLVLPGLCLTRVVHLPVIPLLVLVGGYCFFALRRDASFDRTILTRATGARVLVAVWLPVAVALTAWVAWRWPDQLFDLPRRDPVLWAAVMVLYPLLSVAPQEVIYRVFFFHRYRSLFRDERIALAVSAILFGAHHLLFGNGIAVVLSAVGGFKFGLTFLRTRSLRAIWIEHALYGCTLFTIGMGRFFYHGTVHAAEHLLHR